MSSHDDSAVGRQARLDGRACLWRVWYWQVLSLRVDQEQMLALNVRGAAVLPARLSCRRQEGHIIDLVSTVYDVLVFRPSSSWFISNGRSVVVS